jgi:hypothetical protein
MRKFLIGLVGLFFTLPAFASLDHWTCSNEQTVLYMALNTDEGNFVLWDDKGGFLTAAKFTDAAKTPAGNTMLYAILENGTGVGIAKSGENSIILRQVPLSVRR